MTGSSEEELREIIDNLSSKKHLLTEEALKAKASFDQFKEDAPFTGGISKHSKKKVRPVEEFNENVQLLLAVFKHSKFDEFIYLLSNPSKLFAIQLLIGIIRGIGFSVGVLLVLFMGAYFFQDLIISGAGHVLKSLIS